MNHILLFRLNLCKQVSVLEITCISCIDSTHLTVSWYEYAMYNTIVKLLGLLMPFTTCPYSILTTINHVYSVFQTFYCYFITPDVSNDLS